jgi:hypothetical protein
MRGALSPYDANGTPTMISAVSSNPVPPHIARRLKERKRRNRTAGRGPAIRPTTAPVVRNPTDQSLRPPKKARGI